MISLLLSLVVILLVCGVFYWAVNALPLPPVAKQIGTVLVVLVALLWLLAVVGIFDGHAWRVRF